MIMAKKKSGVGKDKKNVTIFLLLLYFFISDTIL